jgi:hypothetical protein
MFDPILSWHLRLVFEYEATINNRIVVKERVPFEVERALSLQPQTFWMQFREEPVLKLYRAGPVQNRLP